jgi:hypothetical protein
MPTRVFLVLSALVWLSYGLYCFAAPASLAGGAGVAFQSPTGSTELRAMYGGLQVAIGALAALGALRAAWQRHALVALAFLTAGLGVARLAGLALDGGLSSYTGMALAFEWGSAVAATLLLARESARPATPAPPRAAGTARPG